MRQRQFLQLTVLSLIFCIQGSAGIFWPCETNDDCTAAGSQCSPQSHLCECDDFGSVFSSDFTECLKTSLFGDTCVETVQCNLMPSGANCKSGVCDCADGHQYVRGRCRPSNGLDQPCASDLDCYFGYDRQSVSCQNNICACADGYYRRHGNICRRKSMKIDDACVVDTDCDDIASNVQCKNLQCQFVDEISIRSSKQTNAQTHLPTRTHTHTDSLSNSDTTADTPKTETASTSTDIKSDFDATVHLGDGSENTPILVNGDNDSTDTETDALVASDHSQQPLQQKAESAHKPLELKRSREIAVQTSLEAYEFKDLNRKYKDVATATASTSTSSRFTYSTNKRRRAAAARYHDDDDIKTFSTLSNTDDDVAEKQNYGSACTENGKPCFGLPHSICSNNICFCRPGYYHKKSKCFAELGEIAESSDECEYEFDEPTSKCVCQRNYFYERNLRSCRKPIPYNLSCTSNSQCSPFGAAFCRPDIPRRCNCAEYAEYDAYLQMCVFKQGLGAECERNEGCPVENSMCSNNVCVCKDKYFEKDGACLPGIGADCVDDGNCMTAETVCVGKPGSEDETRDRTCQCRKGFVHFKDQCLKEAEDIEEECIETEQCKPLLASCVDKKCTCSATQQFKNGRCETKKGLGEACSRAGECFVEKDPENVECRNSVCQCKFDYKPSTDHKTCIRVMPNKKNSSGRPSALKIITFVLIGSAFLITSAAIKQAYY